MFDGTAARVLLAIEPDDSIRRVAQHLHAPYETGRQAVNRLSGIDTDLGRCLRRSLLGDRRIQSISDHLERRREVDTLFVGGFL